MRNLIRTLLEDYWNFRTSAPTSDWDGNYSTSQPTQTPESQSTGSPRTSVPWYLSYTPPPTQAPTPCSENPYAYVLCDSSDDDYYWDGASVNEDDFHLYNDDDDENYSSSAWETIIALLVMFCATIFIVKFCAKSPQRAPAEQPPANPTSSNQPESRPVPFQKESRLNSATPAPSAPLDPQTLRSKVVKVLFPEEKIDSSQLKFDSEANSYRWTSNNQKSNTSCSICLERFGEGDLIISGLCSHIYHRECVMTWVEANDSCPMCRQPMFDEATYKAIEEQIISLDV